VRQVEDVKGCSPCRSPNRRSGRHRGSGRSLRLGSGRPERRSAAKGIWSTWFTRSARLRDSEADVDGETLSIVSNTVATPHPSRQAIDFAPLFFLTGDGSYPDGSTGSGAAER
jgi:hypothetical protein